MNRTMRSGTASGCVASRSGRGTIDSTIAASPATSSEDVSDLRRRKSSSLPRTQGSFGPSRRGPSSRSTTHSRLCSYSSSRLSRRSSSRIESTSLPCVMPSRIERFLSSTPLTSRSNSATRARTRPTCSAASAESNSSPQNVSPSPSSASVSSDVQTPSSNRYCSRFAARPESSPSMARKSCSSPPSFPWASSICASSGWFSPAMRCLVLRDARERELGRFLQNRERQLAVGRRGRGRHHLPHEPVRKLLVGHDRDFARGDLLLFGEADELQHPVRLRLELRLERGDDRIVAREDVCDLADGLAVYHDVLLRDDHDDRVVDLGLRDRRGQLHVLRVRQHLDLLGRIHEQEEHEDHEHVDHRDEIDRELAFVPLVVALHARRASHVFHRRPLLTCAAAARRRSKCLGTAPCAAHDGSGYRAARRRESDP